MAWVAPVFAQYDLGEQYTAWLYGDPQSNPDFYNDPSRWEGSGVVMVQARSFTRTLAVGSGQDPFSAGPHTETINLDLTGGRNAVVLARYAFAAPTDITLGGGITQQLPTQTWGYVWVKQVRVDGYQEIQPTVLPTVFGTGWSPHKFPAPIMWNDKLRRNFTISSVDSVELDVTVVWDVAYLNSGA